MRFGDIILIVAVLYVIYALIKKRGGFYYSKAIKEGVLEIPDEINFGYQAYSTTISGCCKYKARPLPQGKL